MANVLTGSPLKMDTATANYAAMTTLPNSLALEIRMIYWEKPAATNDTFQFTDADGLVLVEGTAEAAPANAGNSLVFYFQPRSLLFTKAQGWFLKQISSGTLWIYFVYA